jgi:hypothetical protein
VVSKPGPARTAKLDQEYTRIKNSLDGVVRDSRSMVDQLGPEEGAVCLTSWLVDQGYSGNTLASYLAVAIIQLQQREAP